MLRSVSNHFIVLKNTKYEAQLWSDRLVVRKVFFMEEDELKREIRRLVKEEKYRVMQAVMEKMDPGVRPVLLEVIKP